MGRSKIAFNCTVVYCTPVISPSENIPVFLIRTSTSDVHVHIPSEKNILPSALLFEGAYSSSQEWLERGQTILPTGTVQYSDKLL